MRNQGRSFLLLQGPCTAFFRRLAQGLESQGHRVTVMNFNGGDSLFRRGTQQVAFNAPLEELPGFMEETWQRHGITDQLMFGDQRPVHHPAIQGAAKHGIRTHVFEEGYLRPFWITLEREGVNRNSLLPRDPAWYLAAAEQLGPPPKAVKFRSSFRRRATQDVLYHLASLYNPLGFRHYRNHAPITAPVEYAGYLRRFLLLRLQRHRTRDTACIKRLRHQANPYFVLPLQLNSDAQIRNHSAYSHMDQVIATVMASFAQHAPQYTRLVIKNHPLDMGLDNYPATVATLAKQFGITERIDYLETGNLDHLMANAAGLVNVNSTSGLVSLEHGCPTFALSDPMYAIPGLTHQGSLENFWNRPQVPNNDLFQAFRTTLLHTVQINGGFYCNTGTNLALDNTLARLTATHSPLEALLECLPQAA